MRRLSQHILSLLRLYDNVSLPGVGVFSVDYVAAAVDREKGLFIPPHHNVSFTEYKVNSGEIESGIGEFEILSADNRLLDSYIRKERVSPEEAWEILASDLAEFKSYIAFGGSPVLEEFKFFDAPYPALRVTSLKDAVDLKETDGTLPEVKEYGKDFRNPDYYYIPIHKKVAKFAACLLLVVAVGLAAVIPFRPSGNPAATASIVPIAISGEPGDSVATTESSDLAEENLMAVTPELNNDTIPGASSLETAPFVHQDVKTVDNYYAVIAAFKSEKEANKFIDAQKGDKARFNIIKNPKYYLVSATSAPDKASLEVNMPLIRSSFPDAWIFALK